MEAFVDARVEEIVTTARDSGAATGEFRLRGPDGPMLVVRARRSPVRGVWVVLEDVSELRRLQQIRAEFVDNLSHELRTPLSTVSLLAETLARDAEAAGDAVPPKMRDRIAKIEVETGHLVQMVNELLDLARIESGGPLVLLDDVDIGRVVAESPSGSGSFAERQGAAPRRRRPGRLPRGPRRRGPARPGRRQPRPQRREVQRATAATSTVAVRVRDEGTEVVVSVEDHGIGIPKADQARIFERFYKVDRARVRGGGTGLGLSIARHVVAAARRPDLGRVRGGRRVDVLVRAADPRRRRVGTLSAVARLHVATLNIRNLADRWDERLPLLLADMAALQPDVLGLQEVVYPLQQDRLIGAAGEGRYESFRAGPAGRSTATRCSSATPLAAAPTSSGSTSACNRSALRLVVDARRAARVLVAVTHLHHVPADEAPRDDQAPTAARLARGGAADRRPDRRRRLQRRARRAGRTRGCSAAGFRSAYAEANGAEPAVTWPSGLQAPGDGHRRRARLPRLHLGPRRGPRRVAPGSRSTGPRSTTRRSTRATTSGWSRSSRSGRAS